MHLTETGIAADALQLAGVRSARELLDVVARAAKALDATGTVMGHGWDESTWQDRTLPTAEELDRAAGGRKVYLARVDAHSALASPSLASAAGIAGLDGYDGSAHVLRAAHTASRLVARQFPEAERRRYQELAVREAAANGYVALAEMAAPHLCSIEDLRMSASWNESRAGAPRSCPIGANSPHRPSTPLPSWMAWTYLFLAWPVI